MRVQQGAKVLASIKLILMILLACPALHIIDAVPVNLSLNHNLLCQTGDLTSTFAKKKAAVAPMCT